MIAFATDSLIVYICGVNDLLNKLTVLLPVLEDGEVLGYTGLTIIMPATPLVINAPNKPPRIPLADVGEDEITITSLPARLLFLIESEAFEPMSTTSLKQSPAVTLETEVLKPLSASYDSQYHSN